MSAAVGTAGSRLLGRLARFAIVGGAGSVVDVGLFNVLRGSIWAPDSVADGVLIAKTVSTLCAIGINWLGNRYWAFRDRRRKNVAREGFLFLAASGIGLLVDLICSHDLLGLTTALDDNVSTNVVGLLLGTVVRFALYRAWVYRDLP